MINKETGSYYTPKVLSDFLVKHIFERYINKKNVSILEPSCGDGEFIKSIVDSKLLNNIEGKLDIVDIISSELRKAKSFTQQLNNFKTTATNKDFLDFNKKGYDLIIGNPPYISKKLLSAIQIEKCKKICTDAIDGYGETKNIWPSFLLKSADIINPDGILCFVLPSELLQVNYALGIREFLLDNFQRIEIFSFNELIFVDAKGKKIEQDVVALIAIKKHEVTDEHGVSFYQVDKLDDLKIPDYTQKNFNVHRKRLSKWTNYILEDTELEYIENIVDTLKMNPIISFCDKIEVGIVTAANKYFIVNKEAIRENKLNHFSQPIIHKGTQVQDKISINSIDFSELNSLNKSVNLIKFSNKKQVSRNAISYIAKGVDERLNERYKMTLRKFWFNIPSVWKPEAFFMKRTHQVPRIILNDFGVYVTDSFYRINSKPEFDIKSIVFSFYNSLTFTLAELEGRFYGGGVLELIPSEFKKLNIPYKKISNEQFDELDNLFRQKVSLIEILNFTDNILIKELDNNTIKEIQRLRNILINRRLKLNS